MGLTPLTGCPHLKLLNLSCPQVTLLALILPASLSWMPKAVLQHETKAWVTQQNM